MGLLPTTFRRALRFIRHVLHMDDSDRLEKGLIYLIAGEKVSCLCEYPPYYSRRILLHPDAHQRLTVAKITYYKSTDPTNHEHIACQVKDGEVIVGWMYLDRHVHSTPTEVLANESKSSSSAKKPLPAKDYITLYNDSKNYERKICERVLGSESTIRPYHVIAAAMVVHDSHPVYDMRNHQCYWFAMNVFALLTGSKPDIEPVSDDPEEVKSRFKAGHIGWIPLVKADGEELEKLRENYKVKVSELEGMIVDATRMVRDLQQQAAESQKNATAWKKAATESQTQNTILQETIQTQVWEVENERAARLATQEVLERERMEKEREREEKERMRKEKEAAEAKAEAAIRELQEEIARLRGGLTPAATSSLT